MPNQKTLNGLGKTPRSLQGHSRVQSQAQPTGTGAAEQASGGGG